MAVTDQQLYNECQMHLLETENNGASFGSGLYTVAEMVARTNYRLDLFNALTGVKVTYNASQTATSGIKAQDISTAAPNLMSVLYVFYSSNAGTTYYMLPKGSSLEADMYITTQSAVTLPSHYALDSARVLNINLFPMPTFAGSDGKINLAYIPKVGVLPATPDGTTIGIPDDFTPFIKYGVLADLFRKSGETYDPVRAEICEQLFTLGVEVTRGWLSGTPTPPAQ